MKHNDFAERGYVLVCAFYKFVAPGERISLLLDGDRVSSGRLTPQHKLYHYALKVHCL